MKRQASHTLRPPQFRGPWRVPAAGPVDLHEEMARYVQAATEAGCTATVTEFSRLYAAHFPPGPRAGERALEPGGLAAAASYLAKGLIKQGRVTRLPFDDGLLWVEGIPEQRSRSLEELVEHASKARDRGVAEGVTGKKGRRAQSASVNVRTITDGMYTDIERAARLICRHVPGALVGGEDGALRPDFARVRDCGFWYDDTVVERDGRMEERGWVIAEQVAEWVREEFEERHRADLVDEARRLRRQRKLADQAAVEAYVAERMRRYDRVAAARLSVSKYVGAVNNLMRVASTPPDNIIPATARHTAWGGNQYHPTWAPRMELWRSALMRRQGAGHSRQAWTAGVRMIAIYLTRQRATDLRTADWAAVRREIERDFAAGKLNRHQFDHIRRVWRAAVARVRRFVPGAAALAWETYHDNRRWSLVPLGAVRTVAAGEEAALNARDFLGWIMDPLPKEDAEPEEEAQPEETRRPAPYGAYPAELIEGEYGLRALTAWWTLPEGRFDEHVATFPRMLPLPPRVWTYPLPNGKTRRAYREVPGAMARDTVEGILSTLTRVAGFARTRLGIDPATNGLEALVSKAVASAYVADAKARAAAAGKPKRGLRLTESTVFYLATLANGFCAGRAAQRLARAVDAGDEAARRQAEAEVEQFRRAYVELQQLGAEVMPGRSTRARARGGADRKLRDKLIRARNNAIARGWRGADHVDGITKIIRLRDLLVERASKWVGELTLDEQVAAIEAGTLKPGSKWAQDIRLACLLTLLANVPLRRRALHGLTLDMLQNSPVGPTQMRLRAAGLLPRWEGAWTLHVPAELTKSGEPFNPALALPKQVRTPEQAGDEGWERFIHRRLWAVYLMPGGARDWLCTTYVSETGKYERRALPWLFPDSLPKSPTLSRKQRKRLGREDGRWNRQNMSATFRRAVCSFAADLGIHLEELERIHASLSIHVVRKLYASYHAPRALVSCCIRMDHADPRTTLLHYVEQDESSVVLGLEAETSPLDALIFQISQLTQQLAESSARESELRAELTHLREASLV